MTRLCTKAVPSPQLAADRKYPRFIAGLAAVLEEVRGATAELAAKTRRPLAGLRILRFLYPSSELLGWYH